MKLGNPMDIIYWQKSRVISFVWGWTRK